MIINYMVLNQGSDATGWFRDYSTFYTASGPFMVRGGNLDQGVYAGFYYFCSYNGTGNSVNWGGRVVLGI